MKNSFVIVFGIAGAWALMNILFPIKAYADDTKYVFSESGALIIIENAESYSYLYDVQDGTLELKIEPSPNESTYIFGEDELTIIDGYSVY